MSATPPLILTCSINPEAFSFFNEQRIKYFPPDRNFLDAHLTLFHHLPAGEPAIMQAIQELCTRQPVITLQVKEVVFTGKGVAYRIDSPELKQLHRQLQQRWQQWLISQDRQGLWPHITVQNKVDPATSRLLHQELADSFTPFDAVAMGLGLWEYLGGPWKLKEQFLFGGKAN